MKHVAVPGFLYLRNCRWSGEETYGFHTVEMGECENGEYITIKPFTLEFDIPDDFDPRGKKIEALQAAKQKLMAEFSARCIEIERQIGKLQAIEHEVVS